jgi:thiamine-phosphate pyrophosphorylase
MTVRFFLVAPDTIDATHLLACARAACKAADCASILVPAALDRESVEALQGLGLAVILNNAEPRNVHHVKADGLQVSSLENLQDIRKALKNESLGVLAGVSRHDAMEAAEAGVDYVAFTQTRQYAGEPIIKWWQDVTEVPAVAFDPVGDATLKPQRPDFVRPHDDMWQTAEAAARVLTNLAATWFP